MSRTPLHLSESQPEPKLPDYDSDPQMITATVQRMSQEEYKGLTDLDVWERSGEVLSLGVHPITVHKDNFERGKLVR